VLLDFTSGHDNPATQYIGAAIRKECGLADDGVRSIADVPSRSLLSRLTDHYMQIIANRAPVGFEAEFVNQRGLPICYRGILMPFSSDGDTIDFIYGVINWKQAEESAAPQVIVPVLPPIEDDNLELSERVAVSLPEPETDIDDEPAIEIDADAGLADRLWAARETAETVKSADHRSRSALYRALALAYDFALAAEAEPEDYAELLEESGMKSQARAPMTPIVKLVFGIDYDKTRLTEFAAALSHAQRLSTASGEFLGLIERFPGGLKGVVAAERQARRPEARVDTRGDAARDALRNAAPLALGELDPDGEFSLVIARRLPGGGVEAVALVHDEALLEKAIRAASA